MYTCVAGAQCLHGGCFRAESCAECDSSSPVCGAGVFEDSCFCSQTVGGVPVCYANENYCAFEACEANRDCPVGRACVDVSCVCGPTVQAVCLFPCPVS
jgi:hypothetical protein